VASEKNPESFSQKFSRSMSRLAIWPTLFAAILLLLVFYQPFVLTESNRGPLFVPVGVFLHPNDMPIWNSHTNCGMPIWGDPAGVARLNIFDSAFFSVLQPLRSFVPDVEFLYLFLNLLMFCAFVFALARQNKIAPAPAAYMALVLLLAPQYVYTVLSGAWMEILSLCLLPAVLLFTQLFLQRRTLLWFALASFFYAFQLLRASAVISIVTTIFMLAIFVLQLFSKPARTTIAYKFKGGLLLLAVIIVGFLTAAYVYAPFVEYFRFAHLEASRHALSLADLLLFLLPSFNGAVLQSTPHLTLYFSVSILFFAGFALLLRRDAAVYAFAALVVFSIIASIMGWAFAGVYAIPILLVFLAGFGLDALAAFKKNALKGDSIRRVDIFMIMTFSVFIAVAALLLINKSAFMHHILKQIPLLPIPGQQAYYRTVLTKGALSLVFIGFAFIVIRLFLRAKIGAGAFVIIALLLTLIDLLLVDYKIKIAPQEQQLPRSQLQRLQQDDSRFRIFSTLGESFTEFESMTNCSPMQLDVVRDFYSESGYNEPDMAGMRNPFFSKYTRLVSRFGEIIEEPIPVQYIEPARLNFDRSMLDMLNVKYILCNSPIYDPVYRAISDSGVYIYENSAILPRAFFVDSVAVLAGRRAIFDAMKAPDYYPTKVLYLEKTPPFQVQHSDSNQIEVTHSSGRTIKLEANIKQPAVLLLSEVFYPAGWKAFVDGDNVEIYRANYFLRALFVRQGVHEIEFQYRPFTFIAGWWISAVVIGLLLATLLVGVILESRTREK